MRIGFVCAANVARLEWGRQNGFRSFQWNWFHTSPVAPGNDDWKPFAENFAGAAIDRGLRISSIAALYQNPLDPAQSEFARNVFQRAIDVAAHIGIKSVAGFIGAVIETEHNARGGNPVYKPLENFIPQVLAFWEPLARDAAAKGVRLAFENCPQGAYHLPVMHYNLLGQPALWERFFDATKCENIGIEWDPSHLICQFIDPVANARKFGSKIFHVHAKDAWINRDLLKQFGICHPGVAEHRFPGLGDVNWPEIIRVLLAAGYESDLNIEGWHDPVFRDHKPDAGHALAGVKLEDRGLVMARRWLEQFVPPET